MLIRLNKKVNVHHPWVLSADIDKPGERVPPGSVVDVEDAKGHWIGRAFYNGHARVSLRFLTHSQQEPIDFAFFRNRIARAGALRESLGIPAVTDAYRLVHSEGDELSGLIIDRFRDVFVVELFAAGMFKSLRWIEQALGELYPGAQVFTYVDRHVQKQESFDFHLAKEVAPISIREHDLHFWVHPGEGHKTGFFLDQRENRKLLTEMVRDRSVLDLCSYSGGFALSAARGGARRIVAVDRDPAALRFAEENAQLNGITSVDWHLADIIPWLDESRARGEQFDVVVLDPAKQTRDASEVPQALRNYREMNRRAIQVLALGGILVSCSCTGWVTETQLLETVAEAGRSIGREVQVFRLSGAASDHPFIADVPESRYLKVVWARL